MTSLVLKQGNLYRIHYKLQLGNGQWFKYEATMTYLGADKFPQYARQEPGTRETSWNLRPHAGTQKLRVDQIISVTDLGPTQGREDSRHKPKRPLGRIKRQES